ncbi:J domain-containing protein [Iningainema tapete]|uniref:J domain-containing protein n=1 Tax=Iningainema tapete BLCC-T55 TaxID=2748662 RepID=A0A8J6XG36_9CYAN|nr:J domain-containing protein [Iningainema tapete]MBD2776120.1 J domain-containing protein [Iningainema tapete BLCC-T55]
MPRSAKRPTQPSTTPKPLALSSLHIRLDVLEKEHQKILKQIKRKRTELNNFVEQMRSIATELFCKSSPGVQKMGEIDQEIHALFDEILTKRKFGKQTRKNVEAVYRNLQLAGIISRRINKKEEDIQPETNFESFEQEDDFSEQNHQTRQEVEFPSRNSTDESKRIRQAFLRLAEIFHPDKVTDSEKQMHHTEVMKEINKAYQDGDLARLLEIEQQHQAGEIISYDSEDDLTRKCTRLEKDNEFLKMQYENLKRELRQVKSSPEGKMVSDYRKAAREDIDVIGQMLAQVESEIKIISQVRDFVKDFREQKISVKEFLTGPPILSHQQMMEDLFEQMLNDLEEMVVF